MFHILNYEGFVATILVFSAVPGAGTIAILDATARGGPRTGLAAVAGTLVGDFAMMVASVAGLAALLQLHPQWLQALQWFGMAYLAFLAWQMLRAPVQPQTTLTGGVAAPWLHFRKACLVSLTNPKVLLFFVAFFPLFLAPDASATTLAAMMAHVTLISAAWQGGLVAVGNRVALRLHAWPQARWIATRTGGAVLALLALRLAPPLA